jgi:hypothetical protein
MTETREPVSLEAFARTGVPGEPVRANPLCRSLAKALLVNNLDDEHALHNVLEHLGFCRANLSVAEILSMQDRLRDFIDERLPLEERPVAHARLDHLLLEITR